MVNAENILKVADAIEQHSVPGLGFNMDQYVAASSKRLVDHTGKECGTVACIASWATAVERSIGPEDLLREAELIGFEDRAAAFMGLSGPQLGDLFFAFNHPQNAAFRLWSQITSEQAVRTLRNLAATGEVDWTV